VDEAPTARLRVDPRRIAPGGSVTADASGSSDDVGIATYRFDWGDGTSTTGAVPTASHTYASPGVYHVRLLVTDVAGQTANAQQPVQVREARGRPGSATKTTKATKTKPPKKSKR
jgi:PKD repeat protein